MATGRLPDPNTAPVTAKGDLYTYSTVPAKLAVGNNGETLVADSSATTGLRWQGNFAAGKNKIINGDFGIWQRGTSKTVTADDYYAPDRFLSTYVGGGATVTWSQQTFTPGTAPVTGYEGTFFSRLSATSGSGTTVMGLSQKVEDVRTFANQTATFSFWAKADSARLATILIFQEFGSGGSATVIPLNTTQTLSTSWTRYSFTVAMPSVSGKTIGAGSNVRCYVYYNTGSASGSPQLDTWGWQLEAGNTATAFQTATGTLAGELAACQRYFQRRINSVATPEETVGVAQNWSTTQAFGSLNWMTTMRVAPTVSVSAVADYAIRNASAGVVTLTAFTFDRISTNQCRFNTTVASGQVAGNAGLVAAIFANSATLDASAEL